MNKAALAPQTQNASLTPASLIPPRQGILQRKCACGSHTSAGGECKECAAKKGMLQRKLMIGASNDPLEQEADRVADQVMSTPLNSAINRTPPKIQRFTGQASDGSNTAPPSVEQVLASPGRPLEPDLRQDMEQRFGYDFSQVRVHTGSEAERSAREVNARAYTVRNRIVFGADWYEPRSQQGRQLIAHELTHVVQQSTTNAAVLQRQSDFEKERDAIFAAVNNPKPDWNTAYNLLNHQWMKVMLGILDGFTLSTLEGLVANAEDTRKNTFIGEGGKNRVLAAIFAVKATKKNSILSAEIETAKQAFLTLFVDQRREIVTYLASYRSLAAKAIWKELSKPLLGYVASAYDFSNRFLKHSNELGFDVESTAKTLPITPWIKGDPDPQSMATTNEAEKSFEKSDMVFFSGHQYAQYRRPGLFTNDVSDKCFDIGALSKKLRTVKLVVSTSCATICRDTAKIFQDKFPSALVLGYRYSAPLNGGALSSAFSRDLFAQGPIDLSSSDGLNIIRNVWRKNSIVSGSKEGQPGMLFKNDIEYYENGKWKIAKADSEENKCHYH